MFCSFIIPTIGRPSLSRAVNSALNQRFSNDSWEVIVVNDSGIKLAHSHWQDDCRVFVINTQKRERCFARNTGAAAANGRYIMFLDDDDCVVPDALRHLYQLVRGHPDSIWYYGGVAVVDEKGDLIAERNIGLSGDCFSEVIGGAWIPIQASIVETRFFFRIGGFNPLIVGTEDLDLSCRASFEGKFANTTARIAFLQRGRAWDTSTDYLRASEDIRYSRDTILSYPGVMKRLMKSCVSSYWRGRVVHIYLSAVKYNISQDRYIIAMSRLIGGLSNMLVSIRYLLSRDYWRGIKDEHVPGSLHFIIKDYNEKL